MAGSKRAFLYTSDAGQSYAVVADESNIEACSGAAAIPPALGAQLTLDADACRTARYVNAATGAARTIIVVSNAALAVLPAIVNFWVQSSGLIGASLPFALAGTRGEKIGRYLGDTGLTDGDVP